MTKEDFETVAPLQKLITNRKVDEKKNKESSWLKTIEIKLTKSTPNILEIKYNLTEPPKKIDIAKNKKTVTSAFKTFKEVKLPLLWPNGKELSKAKVKDLSSMLRLVPSDCKEFYEFLKDSRTTDFEDDIEGIGNEIDFEIETEEE